MSFLEVLKDSSNAKESLPKAKSVVRESKNRITEAETKKPEEILRGAGFKIKLVTSTSFGTQIDFAKQYKAEDFEKLLSNFSIKIKGKSVFIVD